METPFIEPIEVHQVHITIEEHELPQMAPEPTTLRHIHEKQHLLQRLRRDKGKWNSNHPRHRLLDALFGYVDYYERQAAEVERLRGLYKKVTKSQHEVRCNFIQTLDYMLFRGLKDTDFKL